MASDRFEHMKLFFDSWEKPDQVLQAMAPDFTMDDPAEPLPIGRAEFGAWMDRWLERLHAAGATGAVENLHQAEIDRDGVLHHWTWWRFPGTDFEGAALITATDEGVTRQRIAYHRRPAI
jgi:hypothetical protein